MARRPRLFAPGLLYHVIVRGNQRQVTFLTAPDYQAYLERLAVYGQRYAVTLYAYCLMPNHVHLLVQPTRDPLAKYMQGVQQSYTQYFNRTHRKVGHLFQGRYKAIVCEREPYLLALIRYLHLNPVRARLVATPEAYPYSGHRAYLKGRVIAGFDPRAGLTLCGGQQAYRQLVLDGLAEGHNAAYYQVEEQQVLGSEAFRHRLPAAGPAEPQRRQKQTVGGALKVLATQISVDPAVVRSADRSWAVAKARTLVAYVLVRRGGFGISAVARYLGRDVATLSSLLARFALRLQREPQLQQEVERLSQSVKI